MTPSSSSISVVIPAYNREATIARAVESALSQRLPPLEIIVVDDGSTDRTGEVVRALAGPIRYVSQENAGASSARNRGVEQARGEWIAFLDSDDFWYPQHLERIAAAIRDTHGRASLYFSDLREARVEGGVPVWTNAGFSIAGDYELIEDATPWALRAVQPMLLPASVVRRRDYQELGGLWEALRVREDTHLFFKLCLGRPACAVAGCGGEITADDDSGGRLTNAFGPWTTAFWQASVLLYDDILRRAASAPTEVRRELAHRLALGHRRLAQAAMGEGQWLRALAQLARAAQRDPRGFARTVLRRSRGAS